jgi:peptidyl-prolyl cis-trans isomerase C
MKNKTALVIIALVFILGVFLSACTSTSEATPSPELPPTETSIPATNTPEPIPTETPLPAALSVNGISISQAYFQDELSRYKISFAEGEAVPSDPEAIQAVIDYLTEQMLLASTARAEGYQATAEIIDQRVQALTEKLGSAENLTNWTGANYYDLEEFRFFIGLGAEAAWQRDKIIAAIPDATEQVRARQIFTINEFEINQAYNNLNAGADFASLAKQYNPETGGELGWFPRGYLLVPQIEEFAFTAGINAHSPVIQSEIGYHIIEVTDKDPQHPLTTDAKLSLQAKALAAWLVDAKAKASITATIQP